MALLETYLPLNPFVDLSVGEAELWGTRAWLDVPQIHAAQAAQLKASVNLVRANGRTQVRFVRGVGGSGKSHLFARLRRDLGDTILYTYAPNPPLQPDTLEAFLLHKVVTSLRQKARLPDGSDAPYSQLRLLAYALLRPVIDQASLPIEQLHEAWCEITLEEQKNLLHDAMLLLEAEHPMVARGVMRCLLNVLRDDKENLAGQWLAGTHYLTDSDLKFLGEPEPMGNELHGPVIYLLGKLAGMARRPLVLVLDQLDLVTSQAQLAEFQRILFALIDQSENWTVFIGLVGERFRFWEENLNQAMRGRVGVPDLERPDQNRLPVIDVTPIIAADKEVLIRRRMAAPTLQRQRDDDGQTSPLYPFGEDDLAFLTTGGAVYARHLLAACSERYAQVVLSGGLTNRVPLADKVDALLEEAMDHSRAESGQLSAVELGERVRDLIETLSESPVTLRPGPLREQFQSFIGTDQVYEINAQRARVIACDSTRRPFTMVLEQLQQEPGNTLLLRSAAATLTGQVTLELFRMFKARNHFHHVSASDAAVLMALGTVLASLREGNYENLLTVPAATEENVVATLRESGRLRSLRVWQAVQAAFATKVTSIPLRVPTGRVPISIRQPAPAPGVPGAPTPAPPVAPGSSTAAVATAPAPAVAAAPLVSVRKAGPVIPAERLSQQTLETVQVLLKMERWMEVRRLHRRLEELGCPCSLEALRYALRIAPLAEFAMLHPLDPADGGQGPQIVLWHEPLH